MNDRLITTQTKPAELNPQEAKGVQLSVTAQQYYCAKPSLKFRITNVDIIRAKYSL